MYTYGTRSVGYGMGMRTPRQNPKRTEFGWGGAAGATLLVDPAERLALVYTHYMLNQQEPHYQPRLRNVLYGCL